MTRHLKSIYTLLILLILSSLPLPNDSYAKEVKTSPKKQSGDLTATLISSAEKLFAYEKDLIKKIDNDRYEGLETELEPINDMMQDVIYLLSRALEIAPNNFKANYLLGQVYVLKMDAGEGFAYKPMHQKAIQYLRQAINASTNATGEKSKAKKLYDELLNYSSEALVEK